MKLLEKKANSSLGIVVSIAIGLLVVTIVVAIAALVAENMTTTFEQANNDAWTSASDTVTAAGNITSDMTETVGILPGWTKIYVIVAIGVGLISLVAGVAYMFMTKE